MKPIRYITCLILLVISAANGYAQKQKPAVKKTTPALAPQQKPGGKIEVLQANLAVYDSSYINAHRLLGDVIFKHENILMFCDSAQFYESESRIKAYGHIHVQQGDTLNLYGDSLDYNGITKIAKLRGHIRMVEKDLVMVCDSANFNVKKSIGWYNGGGTITSAKNKNTLTSKSGYYHSKTKDFYFRGDVQLKSPESELFTDTLRYNTSNETAYFIAPTEILMKDTSKITTTSGWYDTRKEKSGLYKRSVLYKKEKTITADTILYDQVKGLGHLYGNAWMYDTTQKTGLFGGYAFYNENSKDILLTKDPYMVKKFDKDSLYLKADTILSFTDTADFAHVKAFHHVKFYKGLMMGKADSLSYNESDSLLRFYRDPVLWQDQSQLTGNYMQARIYDNQVKNIFIEANSFIISKADTVGYNQIKGKNIYAYFKDDDLYKIKVEGNGQTIYYAGEEGKKYSAVNRADCTDLILYMVDGDIDRITFIYQPDATAFPINKYPEGEKFLKDFKWLGKEKPVKTDFTPVMDFLKTLNPETPTAVEKF